VCPPRVLMLSWVRIPLSHHLVKPQNTWRRAHAAAQQGCLDVFQAPLLCASVTNTAVPLCRLSEIGVRAVADLAGMPNWDWVPDAEVAPQTDGCVFGVSLRLPACSADFVLRSIRLWLPAFAAHRSRSAGCCQVSYNAMGPTTDWAYYCAPLQQWQQAAGQCAKLLACWHNRHQCCTFRRPATCGAAALREAHPNPCPLPLTGPKKQLVCFWSQGCPKATGALSSIFATKS
jgi:hypothetical protein